MLVPQVFKHQLLCVIPEMLIKDKVTNNNTSISNRGRLIVEFKVFTFKLDFNLIVGCNSRKWFFIELNTKILEPELR